MTLTFNFKYGMWFKSFNRKKDKKQIIIYLLKLFHTFLAKASIISKS